MSAELNEPLTISEIKDEEENANLNTGKSDSPSSSMEDPSKLPETDRLDNGKRDDLNLDNQKQVTQNASSSLVAKLPMETEVQPVSQPQPSGSGIHKQHVAAPRPPQRQIPQLGRSSVSKPKGKKQKKIVVLLIPPQQQNPPKQMQPQPVPVSFKKPMNNPPHPILKKRAHTVQSRDDDMTAVHTVKPRMPETQNREIGQQVIDVDEPTLKAKKKRLDDLTPGKDYQEYRRVICGRRENIGRPPIQTIQAGIAESFASSASRSVLLPHLRPQSTKKSEAKGVRNILVKRKMPTLEPKGKNDEHKEAAALPTQPNLDAGVSGTPSAKNNNKPMNDFSQECHPSASYGKVTQTIKAFNSPHKPIQYGNLVFQCDRCSARFLSIMALCKHRQKRHKADIRATCELDVPVINIKQPGILQKFRAT